MTKREGKGGTPKGWLTPHVFQILKNTLTYAIPILYIATVLKCSLGDATCGASADNQRAPV